MGGRLEWNVPNAHRKRHSRAELTGRRERKGKGKNVRYFELGKSLRLEIRPRAFESVNRKRRKDGRLYHRGSERRAVLERIDFPGGSTVNRASLPLALRLLVNYVAPLLHPGRYRRDYV